MRQKLLELREQFQGHCLARDEYWQAVQAVHLELEQYPAFIADGPVKSIEITREGITLALASGLRLGWRPSDIRTAPSVLLNNGTYEQEELDILGRILPGCTTILDIGANLGWYSLNFAQALQNRPAQIYAIEPIPSTFAQLKHNIELNGFQDVIIPVNIGLGEQATVAEFFVPKFTGSVAASRRPLFPDDTNETFQCKIDTLDNFVSKKQIAHLDLIKCDIEGAEYFALRGGAATIRDQRPVIMLEMLRKWSRTFGDHPNDIIEFLDGLGYECWAQTENSLVRFPRMEDDSPQTNFFFFNRERHRELPAAINCHLAGSRGDDN
jgi:FkbM family methyltransferase